MVVKPTRSAKRTLTSRRSATGVAGPAAAEPFVGRAGAPVVVAGCAPGPADVVGAAAAGAPASPVPHSPQKRAVGAFAVPQFGHTLASRAPHSPQNFRPASFAVPQFAQLITIPPLASARSLVDSPPPIDRIP